jgi:TPR repeat protein
MNDDQPTLKVVDRRPFNPDGTPRELSPEDREAADRAAAEASRAAAAENVPRPASAQPAAAAEAAPRKESAPKAEAAAPVEQGEPQRAGRDPLDDPASLLSLIMSLASNAAASLGMMPHPVTGETGVDLKTAKHWIDVLGMLEQKTQGNLDPQEAQVIDSLLADLRMQYVSLTNSPTLPPAKFSATDITGGK